ncbi:MAG: beta-ketoacyl-ACP synthase II [Thermoleophilia bacterium]|nr:beta-ketoacyl-ACP synthase II [Thermoleophilia bacterium]
MSRRVVVTGVGVVSPLGIGRGPSWEAATAGRSGAGPITRFDTDGYDATIACEVKGFAPGDFLEHRVARRADRVTQLAVAAAKLAAEDGGFSVPGDGRRVGCIMATGTGGNGVREENDDVLHERGPDRLSPFTIPHSMLNMPSAMIAMQLGIKGPVFATVTACAAGADAIGVASEIIRRGDADAVMAGGADAMITPFWVAAFDAMRVLAHDHGDPAAAARPFNADREGFLIGEGAAVLLLETAEAAEARGARVICELAGYGASSDAHHITDPDPTGESQARAMLLALGQAGLEPGRVGYVNAHGGGSRPGDPSEVRAIRTAIGDAAGRTLVSGTKSMHGHCMGATGALEAALTVMAIEAGTVPPTINLIDLDPECAGVDHVANEARTADLDAAMTINNGLGGHNAALVFTKADG